MSLNELAAALAKAQSKIKAPVKNRKVDFTHNGQRTKYSYADLADVIDAVKGPLSDNGLSVVHQLVLTQELGYGLKTSLLHTSGQYLDTWYPLPNPEKQAIKAQQFGSALTYARRYSLSSLVGISSDEDDDGAIAAETQPTKVKNTLSDPPKLNTQEKIDAPFTILDELYDLAENLKLTPQQMKENIKLVTGADKKSKDLTDAEVRALINFISFISN